MCAKVIVQSGIKEVVYVKEGEKNTTTNKGKIYEASRRILAAALPPKYTTYKCINIQTHNCYREKGPTVRHVIEWMKFETNYVVDSEADETVKQALQKS